LIIIKHSGKGVSYYFVVKHVITIFNIVLFSRKKPKELIPVSRIKSFCSKITGASDNGRKSILCIRGVLLLLYLDSKICATFTLIK